MKRELPKLIGVIHLPALPGAPLALKSHPSVVLGKIVDLAVKEAKLYVAEGFDGIIIENFGDAPFYKTKVPPETIASMSVIAAAVRSAVKLPLGINVLRNDAFAALAIAAMSGADFIRVNVLSGVVATDQGLIEGEAAILIRERTRLHAEHVGILADVHVKHANTISSRSLSQCIEETAGRGGADGVIITGPTTGRAPDAANLLEAIQATKHARVPLYIGSGMTPESVRDLRSQSVRVIVGSALRAGGVAGAPLDIKRMRKFVTSSQ